MSNTNFYSTDYQGLTRSFCHGKIYCSSITASLVHHKIGIPWDRLHVLTLNEKLNIAGVNLICFDANHCPGSIIILFEPPNGKVSVSLSIFFHLFDISIQYVIFLYLPFRLFCTLEISVFLPRWPTILFCSLPVSTL
jgi:hypothetical protein